MPDIYESRNQLNYLDSHHEWCVPCFFSREKPEELLILRYHAPILTVAGAICLFRQQLLQFLWEVSLGTPEETQHPQHHKHCDQPQPERLLQHALRQRLVRDVQHASLTLGSCNQSLRLEVLGDHCMFGLIATQQQMGITTMNTKTIWIFNS